MQEDIEISDDNKITGTLKYVADYSAAFGSGEDSGNYLALHFDADTIEDETIVVELVGGVHGPVTLDEDQICIFRVTDPETQSIKATAKKEGYPDVVVTWDISDLTLNNA